MADATVSATPTLQEALERHKIVLNQHLGLWQLLEATLEPIGDIKSAVSKGYQDTQAMINALGELESKLSKLKEAKSSKDRTKRQSTEADQVLAPNSKRRRVNSNNDNLQGAAIIRPDSAPVVDASGLFMIDPNPSKVETLLSQPQTGSATESRKKKRRHSESQIDETPDVETSDHQPKSRKKRRRKATMSKTTEDSTAPAIDTKPAREDDAGDEDAHHQAFEAKVALRLKEKEEQRKQKSQKKRKRSSEVSTAVSENGDHTDSKNAEEPTKTQKSKSKKAKKADPAVKGASKGKGSKS